MRLKAVYVLMCAVLVGVALTSVGCPQQRATLRVVNNSSLTIEEVNCTPITDDSWGADLLATTIGPGESADFTEFRPGRYDARAISTTDQATTLFDFTMRAGEIFTWTINNSTATAKGAGGPKK